MAKQKNEEQSFQPDNLWDRVVSGTQVYDSEESVQKNTEKSPPKKKKAHRPWWIGLIAVVLAVSVAAVAVGFWVGEPKAPQPQPEELVTVWVCTETVTYDNNGEVMQKYSDTYDDKGCLILQTEYVKGINRNNTKEYTYDEAQRLRRRVWYNKFGEHDQWDYTYDLRGNLIGITYLMDGKFSNHTEYTYDWNANKIREKSKEANGDFYEQWYAYDDAGNLIEHIHNENDKFNYRYIYTYDEKNREIVSCQYYNGQLDNQTLKTYNLDGQLAVTVMYTGESTYHTLYYYDDQGNCTQTVNQDSNGWIIRTTCLYDAAGNKLEEIYESGDEVIYHSNYLYDKNDREVMSMIVYEKYSHVTYTTYDAAGNKTQVRTISAGNTEEINFTYDAHGNCVEMKIQRPEGTRKTTYAYTQLTVTPQRADELKQKKTPNPDILYGEPIAPGA